MRTIHAILVMSLLFACGEVESTPSPDAAQAPDADDGVDDCAPNPCQNGGTCTDTGDAFSCACIGTFDGPTCADLACGALAECGGGCVDLLTDDTYCSSNGACGTTPCGLSTFCNGGACVPTSLTFTFTGGVQTFTVPTGVTSISVDASGAKAGDGWNVDGGGTVKGIGGRGGRARATLAVTAGEQIFVFVGGLGVSATATGPGAGGFNGGGNGATSPNGYAGGGGGGASDLRRGGMTLNDRIVVAGGGGSGSGWCTAGTGNGGAGGGLTGGTGQVCVGTGGTGGTQNAGGSVNGTIGVGGSTGIVGAASQAGSAGGGGFYGGGANNGDGGGGGSSFVTTIGSSAITHDQGFNALAGTVTIAW